MSSTWVLLIIEETKDINIYLIDCFGYKHTLENKLQTYFYILYFFI